MFWLGPGRTDEQHGVGRLEAAGAGVNDFVFILSAGDQSSSLAPVNTTHRDTPATLVSIGQCGGQYWLGAGL